MNVILIVIGALGTVTRGLIERMSGNRPKYRFIKINQNTTKSPGNLRRLAVTHIPVRNH